MCDLSLSKGVTGVILHVWVVVFRDSVLDGRVGTEGDISEEESMIVVCTLFSSGNEVQGS